MYEDFTHRAQRRAYEDVGRNLRRSFGGDMVMARPDAPSYVLTAGSALMEVAVFPWLEEAIVNIRCCCVMDMPTIPPDCLRFLLDENYKFVFGAFTIDPDGDINFEHTILASKLDERELEASVKAVAVTADKYDDEITRRWGGTTGRDKILGMARQAGLVP
jgi:hypothetical protein